VTSRLDASPREVWDRIVTPEGINDELRPFLRMTVPRGIERLDPASVELGKPIGRSWILLFGVLPIDRDDVTLVELEEGRRFLERSPMLSMKLWEHERTVEPNGSGCEITDRIRFQPRLGLPAALPRPLFRAFFRHRHRRLRRRFGGEQ
jgi:ligand-binding SRPBCC domain-containing protein